MCQQFTSIDDRTKAVAKFMVESKCTVRQAAKAFHISKSTLHKDITRRLTEIDEALSLQVREVLLTNKAQRHLRGGMATRKKYKTAK